MRIGAAIIGIVCIFALSFPARAYELKELFGTWEAYNADFVDEAGQFYIFPDGLDAELDSGKERGHFEVIGENRFLFIPDDHLDSPPGKFCQYRVFQFLEPYPYQRALKKIRMQPYWYFDGKTVSGDSCSMLTFFQPSPDWYKY